jgi:hypothetical protein
MNRKKVHKRKPHIICCQKCPARAALKPEFEVQFTLLPCEQSCEQFVSKNFSQLIGVSVLIESASNAQLTHNPKTKE